MHLKTVNNNIEIPENETYFQIKILEKTNTRKSWNKGLAEIQYFYTHDNKTIDVSQKLLYYTDSNTNKLISCLNRMITNFDTDFHEIFEPVLYCIELEKERKKLTRERNA